jgi:ketosteroid isomerase-like protein
MKSHVRPALSTAVVAPPTGSELCHVATKHRLWHAVPMDDLTDPRFEETIERYYAAVSAQRLDEWLEVLSDDVIVHEPAGSPPSEGRTGASEAWKVLTAPFRSLTFERLRTFFAGSGAAVYWRCFAVGVNGGAATSEGITIFEFDDESRVQAVVSYWDPAALLIELAEAGEEPFH